MKVKVRRTQRGSMTIRFQAKPGTSEGVDLGAALLEMRPETFTPAGLVENLGKRGYRGTMEKTPTGLDATLERGKS